MPAPHGEDDRHVPAARRERNPLVTPGAWRHLASIVEHPDAPRWNYEVGDRVIAEDLAHVDRMRARLREGREPGTGRPGERVIAWVEGARNRSAAVARSLAGRDPARDWAAIPTMDRETLASHLDEVVPRDSDFSRMIVYDTSGTTGHAIHVPQHPRAVAENHAMLEFVLRQHGVEPAFGPGRVACINVGAQRDTVVFATVFSAWGQAAFAKVNFHASVWEPAKARRFFADLAPEIVTGDPVAFGEMLAWGIERGPKALVSTAVALAPEVRRRLADAYACPVIDTYATTETGPVAYANPECEGMNVLPPDLYVELVDEEGRSVREGECGEICVTGGRNPYLPLVRYRTGDHARMIWSDRVRSDPAPRLVDLEARAPVLFRAADGTPLNPVDVGRVIRRFAVVQHAFRQRADRSVEITVRLAGGDAAEVGRLRAELAALFGAVPSVAVTVDERLGDSREGGKVVPFSSELGG